MREYVLHRWERDIALSGFRCVKPDVTAVLSNDRCGGCGAFVGDLDIYNSDLPMTFPSATLDTIEWMRRQHA